MAAEVVSNAEMQFQNSFNSPRFDNAVSVCKPDENTINSDDHISSSNLPGLDSEQQDPLSVEPLAVQPLQSVKSETDDLINGTAFCDGNEANNLPMDDMFSVEMFDFGLNEADSFAMFGDPGQYQDGGMLSPSKCIDNFNTAANEDNSALLPVNEDNTNALVCANTNAWEQAAPLAPLLRSDSDGLTDLEDQLNAQQPTMENSCFPTFADPNVPMIEPDLAEGQMLYDQFNWPPLNEMQCGSCQIFRQIIHSNGIQDTKLEIHSRNGHFYHAVMHTRYCVNGLPSTVDQQIVEFAMANAEYVQQFLLQYTLLRRKEGFVVRHDSLSPYPEAFFGMNDGLDMYFGANSTPFFNQPFQSSYLNPYELAAGLHAPGNGFLPVQPFPGQYWPDRSYVPNVTHDQAGNPIAPVKPPKSNVAAQRERTGKLNLSDLAKYFHLPINVAAKELAICPTVLKKICRRNGMRRWPHRKIKSIERIIMTLEQTIAEGNGEGVESIRNEIAMLKNERSQLCGGLVGES